MSRLQFRAGRCERNGVRGISEKTSQDGIAVCRRGPHEGAESLKTAPGPFEGGTCHRLRARRAIRAERWPMSRRLLLVSTAPCRPESRSRWGSSQQGSQCTWIRPPLGVAPRGYTATIHRSKGMDVACCAVPARHSLYCTFRARPTSHTRQHELLVETVLCVHPAEHEHMPNSVEAHHVFQKVRPLACVN